MVTAVICALNEERQIYNTIRNVVAGAEAAQMQGLEIIVVNDGSTDRTAEIIATAQKQYPFIRCITHDQPHGVGTSFIEAIHAAKNPKVTFFAGDNNAHAQLAEVMFRNADKADIVVSYFINTESRNRLRNLASTIFSTIYVTFFGLHIKYINGNSIYPVDEIKKLKLHSISYSVFSEILIKLLRQGFSFYEVGGYNNPDVSRSQALRLKVLVRVALDFIKLLWQVYVSKRQKFKHRPRRAQVPAYAEYDIDRVQRGEYDSSTYGHQSI